MIPNPEPVVTPRVPSPIVAAALSLALLTACASGSAPAAGGASTATRAPRQDQQLITRDVIVGTQYTNLYDVVQAMRSNWLRVKSSSSASGKVEALVVYLDNQRVGGVEELRRIAPLSVQTVRYFDPIAASARWGMDHGGGAIAVVTAK